MSSHQTKSTDIMHKRYLLFFSFWFMSLTFDLHCRLCGTMFRTKQDWKLKSRRTSGPPFFDLRESISKILQMHINDLKVPQEVIFSIIKYMVGSVSGEGRILCFYWPPERERLATHAIKKENLYCSRYLDIGLIFFFTIA